MERLPVSELNFEEPGIYQAKKNDSINGKPIYKYDHSIPFTPNYSYFPYKLPKKDTTIITVYPAMMPLNITDPGKTIMTSDEIEKSPSNYQYFPFR